MGPNDAVQDEAVARRLRRAEATSAVAAGDLVRMARVADGTWFYCTVSAVLDDGAVVCSVVEAQSWPDLMLDGVVPGRLYTLPRQCVLSVVRPAA